MIIFQVLKTITVLVLKCRFYLFMYSEANKSRELLLKWLLLTVHQRKGAHHDTQAHTEHWDRSKAEGARATGGEWWLKEGQAGLELVSLKNFNELQGIEVFPSWPMPAPGWFGQGNTILESKSPIKQAGRWKVRAVNRLVCLWKTHSKVSHLLYLKVSYSLKRQSLPGQQSPRFQTSHRKWG